MFTKPLFKHLLLLVAFLLVLGSVAIAQQRTYYVDNQLGSNGYDGLSQTVTLPSTGPKATITNAIAAANDGDIILVSSTGVNYTENVTFTDGGAHKLLTIGSYGTGTPTIAGTLTVNNTYPIVAQRALTVTGPLKFTTGLTLTFGNIVGAQNLTINGTVTRTDSASVDNQISLTGNGVNYSYLNSSVAALITTGNELPASTATTIGTFASTGNVTLSRNISLTGAMTVVHTFNLNGATVTAKAGITADSIVGGTITSTNTSTATFAATAVLPSITMTGAAGVLTVTSPAVGSLSASGSGSITATLAGGTAATTAAASIRGSVTNSGSGIINLDRSAAAVLYVSGDIIMSGTGSINVAIAPATTNASGINVGGGASITSTLTMATDAQITNSATISFGAVPTTVVGAVSNATVLTGTIGTTSTAFTNTNLGNISFAGANVLYSVGSISNTSTTDAVVIATGNALTASGNITLAYTGVTLANTLTVGAVTNNATATVGTACGNISIASISATAASSVTLGAVTNSSKITSASSVSSPASNGNIDLTAAGSAAITAASVSTTGGYGGDIQFGIGNVAITGVLSNSRTNTGADVLFGAPTAATTFSAGSISGTGKSQISVTSVTTGTFTVTGSATISAAGATADSILYAPNVTTGNLSFGSLTVTKGSIKITGTGTVTSGSTSVSGGTVQLPTGASSFGNLTLSGGTLTLSTGNPTTAITVSTFNVTAGTLALGTGVRTLTVSGQANTLGGATGFATITGAGTTLVSSTPPSGQGQIVWTIGASNPTWPGSLTVNNTTLALIAPLATVFTGGNVGVTGKVYFQAGVVQLNGTKMYVSSNSGANDFQNASSYQTANNGYVSMTGAAAQVSGAGTFADFEVNNSTGPLTVAASTGNFVGNFYLTSGSANGLNLKFNNQNPYPTIIRNAGSFVTNAPDGFAAAPICRVNVTYIGTDKSAGNEIPVDSLYNLTVATTNGGLGAGTATAGKGTASRGVVTITTGTIYGTLTVNAGQVLALSTGSNLTLKGAAQINGDVVNLVTGSVLHLASKTGTAVNGAGLLPPVVVDHQSVGNSINGTRALVDVQLGADFAIGGSGANADVVTGTKSVANGSLTFGALGTDTSSLSATFAAVADTGSQVGAISTIGSGSNLSVHGTLVVDQTLAHAKGTINIPTVTDTLLILGRGAVTQNISTGSMITGFGVLEFAPHYFANTLNLNGGRDTIATNVLVNSGLGSLSTAVSGLAINGTLTTMGNAAANTGTNTLAIGADTLIARGNVNMGALTSFTGAGALKLDAIAAPLLFSYSGAASIAKLAINNDVNLGGTGTSLTAATLKHSAGVLNFGNRDLTVTDTYVRTGSASYLAGTGYFVDSCATSFDQGTTALTIPNFRVKQNVPASSFAGAGVITVSQKLDIVNEGTLTISSGSPSVNHLSVSSGASVTYVTGLFNTTPNYLGTINLVAKTDSTIPKLIVPGTSTTLIAGLTVDAGANTSTLDTSYTINSVFTLKSGTLTVPATRVLKYAPGITINGNGGVLNLATGSPNATVNFGTGGTANVVYAGASGTGVELPVTVNNLTITRLTDVVNAALNLNSPVTVNGLLTIRNDFTTAGVTDSITALGNVLIALDSGFPTNSSMPVCTFTAPFNFNGPTGQTFTVPSTGASISSMAVNLQGTTPTPVLNIAGGNLTVSGTLTMNNGDISTGTNVLQLGTGSTVGTLARSAGMIYNGMNRLVNTSVAGSYLFPLGIGSSYRPVTITHTATTGNNYSIVRVKVANTTPAGTVGLPLTDGTSVINALSPFNWDIGYWNSSNNNLLIPVTNPTVVFGVSGVTYTNPLDVRSMYRFTDSSNAWRAAGTSVNQFTDLNGVTQLTITQSPVTAWSVEPKLIVGVGYHSELAGLTVSGTVTYGNTAANAIGNVTVTLTPTTGSALTATTSATGTYSITNVSPGSYTLTASKTGNWGGVSGADAQAIAKHAVGITLLTGVPLLAADVNKSGTITAADAQILVQRAVGIITSFTAGDWVFASQTVTVSNTAVTANISGLCVGDVNASYVPASGTAFAKSAPLSIASGTNMFNVNVARVNAGSLTMTISANAKISEISTKLAGAVSHIDGNTARLIWYDATGKNSIELNNVATVKLAEKAAEGSSVNIAMEVTDNSGEQVSSEAVVAAIPTEFSLLQNYPNPFNPSTTINYNLPQSGKVTLTVYNVMGQEVAKLVNEQKSAGSYSVDWAPKNMASGMYIYRITVQTEKEVLTSSKRLMLLK